MMRLLHSVIAFLTVLVLWQSPACAHGFQTAYLDIRERPTGLVDVVWKLPSNSISDNGSTGRPLIIRPVFPANCKAVSYPGEIETPQFKVMRSTLNCGEEGLAGQSIAFPGLTDTFVEVLLRLEWADGRSHSEILSTQQESFGVPNKVTVWGLGQTYLELGIEHILSGTDHLLFVLGLVLIVQPSWMLLKTITAFTFAHSLTLGAATLGLARVPQAPVEAVIALSILFLASELTRSDEGTKSLTKRFPWAVALTFGLLHGFGFAGALAEVGLPPQDIPPALLFFNIGVELGQLVFVMLVIVVKALIARLNSNTQPKWLDWVSAYGIGTMASFWFIQRVSAF